MTERQERINWLRHLTTDPDAGRFFTVEQLDCMEAELKKLKSAEAKPRRTTE